MSEFDDLDNPEFVAEFIKKYRPLICGLGRRYIIPNRYTIEDLIQYISERMLTILRSKLTKHEDEQIKNRERYFSGCLRYYFIEYQRMHGFPFSLPKRPRKNAIEDEQYIKSKEFYYLSPSMLDDPSLVYVEPAPKDEVDSLSGTTDVWCVITGSLDHNDAKVVDCIFRRGMTFSETAMYLDVPQSTCVNRRDRAFKTIFRLFDKMEGEVHENIKRTIRGIITNLHEKDSDSYR